MAYKFQLGSAILSGALTQEGAAEVDALVADSLNVQSGGITNAGSIAGASSIDGSGDLTMGSITMSGFSVDADGDTALKSLSVDNGSTIGCDADADIMTLAAQSLALASDVDFNVAKTGGFQLAGAAVTSTAAEINLLDTSVAGTIVNSKALIYGSNGEVNGTSFELGGQEIIDSDGNFQGNNASFADLTASAADFSGVSVMKLDAIPTVAFASADFMLVRDAAGNTAQAITMANYATAIAGNGLAASSGVLAVGVDDSSVELNGDALRVKAAGITRAMLAADLVDGSKIADDAVDSEHIAAGAIDLAHMSVNSVDSDQYVDGSIDREHLAADIVDGTKIADDSINSEHIVDGSIDLAHMSVNSVDSDQYVDLSIDTAHIADAQITLAKMAVNSVDSDQYVDASIDNVHLANSAVTLAQGAGMAAMGSVSLGGSVTVGVDGVLEDLDTLGAAAADGEFIVATGAGAFAYESGNIARTSLELGTGDSPTFTGLTLTGDLLVQGSTTTIDSTTINISSSFTFEGPADDHETILSCATPGADTTLSLPTLSAGSYFIPALADAATDASAAVTAAEFALLDGASDVSRITVADGDGFLFNDGGAMKQVDVRDITTYVGNNIVETVQTISDDETVNPASGRIIKANCGAGDITLTLPAASGNSGMILKIKKISTSNNVILDGNGSETIDSQLNITLESPLAAVSLICDGSNWYVM